MAIMYIVVYKYIIFILIFKVFNIKDIPYNSILFSHYYFIGSTQFNIYYLFKHVRSQLILFYILASCDIYTNCPI